MKVFAINLSSAVNRRDRISNLCKKLKMDFEIITAIDGRELDENFINDNVYDYKNCFLTKGEIGCALSHIGVYKEIINRRLPYALIIEDDAIFDSRTVDFMSAFEKKPKNGIFLLTGDVEYAKNKKMRLGDFNVFPIAKAIRATGYIITLKTAKKMVEFLMPIRYEADMFEIFRTCGNIKTYFTLPHLIETNDRDKNDSSLEAERKLVVANRENYRKKLYSLEKRPKVNFIVSILQMFSKKPKYRNYFDY
ncbi:MULTISPECIES: glycosyltransferase family 25 protein [unclassified Gilliamella]|uniref:glycosyltransferase family 25 protein n=1 Tax=unclassified Gilliamella TaxID=2685620 RepID=UPI00226ADF5B|nr:MULTISPECIES: glycosyltransferase family 25 protein [unclassified Gilliamella]MCX8588222.1 glycosyltransferase family 25 protein [Gilliamella sp. B3801]MCX8593293.1 glycosyltransferase family 25 protein [Gilliamella sp. B3804]